MIKLLTKSYFLIVMLAIIPKLNATDLQTELDKIEQEDRLPWKVVYLDRLLNESERIEALEDEIEKKAARTGAHELKLEISKAKNDYRSSSERALKLQELLTQKEYINALTKKLQSKANADAYAGA